MDRPLSGIDTDTLARELLSRTDYVLGPGFLIEPVYKLRIELGPIPCVDAIALRMQGGEYEALAIRRATGFYKGRLCTVGGSILLGETFEAAIARHFKTDIGVEVQLLCPPQEPAMALQYYSPGKDGVAKDGFLPEPAKHSVAFLYPVRLIHEAYSYGETGHGGQEAGSVEWLRLRALPPADEFGYGQRVAFEHILTNASRYLS